MRVAGEGPYLMGPCSDQGDIVSGARPTHVFPATL